ncbi:MAG: hypothetical protein ABIA11_00375 [Patescibacteria group bacterium]
MNSIESRENKDKRSEDTHEKVENEILKPFSSEEEYSSSLKRYKDFRNQISSGVLSAPKEDYEVMEDQVKLHDMHDKLLQRSIMTGKTSEEVLKDLLLLDRSLEEYGLPDIPVVELFQNYTYYFPIVVDGKAVESKIPGSFLIDINYKTKDIEQVYDGNTRRQLTVEEYPVKLEEWKKKPHVLLVYGGNWFGRRGDESAIPGTGLKEKRLENVATELDLDAFEVSEASNVPDFHWPQKLYGLIVPYNRLPGVADKIKRNKDRYWITEEESRNIFSEEVLKHETLERLFQYYNGLANQVFGLMNVEKKENYENWDNMLNVIMELKRRSKEKNYRHRKDIENFHTSDLSGKLDEYILKTGIEGKPEALELRNKIEYVLSQG